ncbi:peptidoglycan-binding protein [Demequina subtropica]|uniref:peptidoglycan-binding protein n=1 Tax=Demequina subtropica TaxID=1638989 RepID=UPI000785C034|nr:peptidoglycan-binding protein [Demequina subtropica]
MHEASGGGAGGRTSGSGAWSKAALGVVVAVAVLAVLVVAVAYAAVAYEQRSRDNDAEGAAMRSAATAFEAVAACTALATSELPDGAVGDDARAAARACAEGEVGRGTTSVLGTEVDGAVARLTMLTAASTETGGGADWFAGHGSAGGCWTMTIDASTRTMTDLADVPCGDVAVDAIGAVDETGLMALQGEHSGTPATVAPGVSGELTSLLVTTGDRVWMGDIVAEVDGRPIIAYSGPAPFDDAEAWDDDPRIPHSWTATHAKQALLTALGYDTGGVDGVHGWATDQAVKRYNADHGIAGDELDERYLVWIGDVDRSEERETDGPVVTAVLAAPGDALDGDALVALGRAE